MKTEVNIPVNKSVQDTPAKNAQKSNQNGKDKFINTNIKGKEFCKRQEKNSKNTRRT